MVDRPGYPSRRDADQEAIVHSEQQDVITSDGTVVGQDVGTAAIVDRAEARRSSADWISGVISFIVAVIAILIAIRIVLKLLAANTASGFTSLIYGITNPLVGPFQSIFGTPPVGNGGVFELSSLLAIVIYLLVGWLLTRLVQLLIDRPTNGVSVTRNVGQRTRR